MPWSRRCCGCRRVGDIASCNLGGDAETRLRSSLRKTKSGNRCILISPERHGWSHALPKTIYETNSVSICLCCPTHIAVRSKIGLESC
jgi:hypothetical protein